MPDCPYEVALLTRGTGAVGYTWLGPAGLPAGALCAVVFRNRIETGIVLGVDAAPPQTQLALLWPLVSSAGLPPHYSALLLDLCALSCGAPNELSGYLLFKNANCSFQHALSVHDPEALPALLLSQAGALSGPLKPQSRRLLARAEVWEPLARLSWTRPVAPVELALQAAGSPLATRALPALRRSFSLDSASQRLLGLGLQRAAWPGHYLAGLADAPSFRELSVLRTGAVAASTDAETGGSTPAAADVLPWQPAALNPAWEICTRWPALSQLPLRRLDASWEELRQSPPAPGLAQDIGSALERGEKLLLIAPQAWLLDRLWPLLAPWAESCLRFRAESGPGSVAYLLARLAAPGGLLCASGPAGFKLAAWQRFDRVLLLDPTHPQYLPQRAPYLDPRLALLLALARWLPTEVVAAPASVPRLDLVELGLSALDGAGARLPLRFWPPHEPDASAPPQRGRRADTDPLPLTLRQPGTRRLVYFNRLGSGHGLSCAECQRPAHCPNCSAGSVYYSQRPPGYVCPNCNWRGRELRCAHCGLATLSMQSPGLEAVLPRSGDITVAGSGHSAPSAQTQRLLGTASLLDEESAFWPQEIVYVHAESRIGPASDWPAALDMALRLAALYANPQLASLHIVSARLEQQFGPELSAAGIPKQFKQEQGLRKLAGLPPFACLYELHCTAGQSSQLEAARTALGEALSAHPGTRLLRLGKPYSLGRGLRLSGYLSNAELPLRELWELRWRIFGLGVALHINALRNSWGL